MEPKRKSSQVAKQLNKLIPAVQASLLTICLLMLTSPLSNVNWACAPAPPELESVSIANEEAIIIWDQAIQTQHFIRRADFESTADDFGFLVPTPTQPTLTEASNDVFPLLAKITAPEIIYETTPHSGGCYGYGCGGDDEEGAPPPVESVRVLEETRVAGFNAAILEADNIDALSYWLKDHGYAFSPGLEAWIQPYVAAGWKISAFKIAKDQATGYRVLASTVRMSFKTEQPFFPCSEPPQPARSSYYGQRLLRIYFLSQNRVHGQLGLKSKRSWSNGKTVWSDWISPGDSHVIQRLLLPEVSTPQFWRLTEFEDHSQQRPGIDQPSDADLLFSPSKDQKAVKRLPIVHYVSEPGVDVTLVALATYLLAIPLYRRFRL